MGPRERRGPIIRPLSASRARASVLTLLVAVTGVLVFSCPAAASAGCSDAVLDDWFDNGRVDRLYRLGCYDEAIDGIPSDIRDYSDAEAVISRALQAATRGKLAAGGLDPTPRSAPRIENGDGMASPYESRVEHAPSAAADSPRASSVPIPLLALGGVSLALLAAGGYGRISRRRVDADCSTDDTRS